MPNSLKYSCHIIQKIVKAKNQSIGSLFLTSPQIDAVCFHLLLFVYFLVYFLTTQIGAGGIGSKAEHLVTVVVHLHCQHGWIWNYLGDTLFSVSM